jgi:hypothetical protein
MTTDQLQSQRDDPALPDAVALSALDELQFLCRRQMEGLGSPELVRSDLAGIEQRIGAYADALVVRGPAVIEWLSTILPTAETAADACGIAMALLEARQQQAVQSVLAALATAEAEPLLHGLQAALRRGPIDLVLEPLKQWFISGSPREAVAAAETLAFHRQVDKQASRLSQLVEDEDPTVRRAAWRAMALVG